MKEKLKKAVLLVGSIAFFSTFSFNGMQDYLYLILFPLFLLMGIRAVYIYNETGEVGEHLQFLATCTTPGCAIFLFKAILVVQFIVYLLMLYYRYFALVKDPCITC